MDNTQAVFLVLLAFGIIRGLRGFLGANARSPAWDAFVDKLRLPAVLAVGLYVAFDWHIDKNWVWLVIWAGLINTLRLAWHYKPARTLLLASAPFLVLSVLKEVMRLLLPAVFKDSKDLFESAIGFSFVWLGTFMIIASRQKKTLLKEQAEREAREARQQLVEQANVELEHQVAVRTAELTRQKEELLQTVANLKATQEQLVQKEKMASLGELTAGIAHEIQNPINFVNNFAQVSIELLDELSDEIQVGHTDDARDLMQDIRQNLGKINHHGHRADSIVKAMLQHSRSSTGERQLTDINALCDEYLRLSYHGLRAKDSTFNATMLTEFDPAMGQLTVVGQDIGRVLLNLFNNSFYAVSEKKKQLMASGALADYRPTVTVSTRRAGDCVRVRVRDNGCGIPPVVLDKIYQPFFTTKPTGEGTGLGLSLSFDIITKGHGGTLLVDTREGEFTEFLIELPTS